MLNLGRCARRRPRGLRAPLVAALLGGVVSLFSAAGICAQAPPPYTYNSPRELNQVVSSITLYPDSLLSQVLAAATFPDEISGAAEWADTHHRLTGKDLAAAIAEDHLPWDGSVQALLPFPSVLEMMAGDMDWTTNLGGAFMAQRADLMDSIQETRRRARSYGYLSSNSQVIVSAGPYVEISPVNPALVAVPRYDSTVVFAAPKHAVRVHKAITFSSGVKLGRPFLPWGWGVSRFHWAQHDVFTHRPASRYEPQDRREMHELSPRTPPEREQENLCATCGPS